MPDSSSSLELAAVFSQNERALFIRESARVLFITEYIVLVEYVEVVLPLVYLSASLSFYLNGRAVVLSSRRPSLTFWSTVLGTCFTDHGDDVIETKPRVFYQYANSRSCRESSGIIQAKLLILFIYVMQISLVHIAYYKYSNARLAIVGADFSFKFAWLHDSKPSE
ncbi:hypothetical protein GQ600_26907 [Phytophthora cactorum]|nr:hypothetical protein GQ600_26907 [Phytophthora cactorum]